MEPSSEDIARNADRLRDSWIARNPWTAVLIAASLCLVLGAVAGDFRQGKRADGYLKIIDAWATAYKRDITATQKAYEVAIREKEKKVRAANAKYAALRKRVDEANAASNAPWTPPSTDREMVERFRASGYPSVLLK